MLKDSIAEQGTVMETNANEQTSLPGLKLPPRLTTVNPEQRAKVLQGAKGRVLRKVNPEERVLRDVPLDLARRDLV